MWQVRAAFTGGDQRRVVSKRPIQPLGPSGDASRIDDRRSSSGVERTLGKGEAEGSIPSCGTIARHYFENA